MSGPGRLVIVGTGIQTVGQLTNEAIAWLGRADLVLHVVANEVAGGVIDRLAPGRNRSLVELYERHAVRRDTYREMVDVVVRAVEEEQLVVGAFYGHPGVFSTVPHEAIQRVRAGGREATMCAAVSAEDCLFADLGVDPAAAGCMSIDATEFLITDRPVDPAASLVLWQIGRVGIFHARPGTSSPAALAAVVEKLAEHRSVEQPVAVYAAATLPRRPPDVRWMPLAELPGAELGNVHTLYVPPAGPARPDRRFDRFREGVE